MSDQPQTSTNDEPEGEGKSIYGENHPREDDRPEPDIREEMFKKGHSPSQNSGDKKSE